MSAAVLDAPANGAPATGAPATRAPSTGAPRPLFAEGPGARTAGGRRATLEEVLEGAWRSARSDGQAECPVCHAGMHLANGYAHCDGCGTTLS